MFPCSSIHQNFRSTNQTHEIIDEKQDHQNPNCYSQLPTFCEEEGLMFSHLLPMITPPAATTATTNAIRARASDDYVRSTTWSFSKKEQMVTSGDEKRTTVSNPRRRAGKKDRHSKISTAQGLRDRRMRLSLQIARKFFDLQDMLGFDKASKTIDWLFNKSKTAITELKHSLTKRRDDGDCDDEILVVNEDNMPGRKIKKKSNVRKLYHSKVAKESRDMARARARERTRERKLLQKTTQKTSQPVPETTLKSIGADHHQEVLSEHYHHNHVDLLGINEKFQDVETSTMTTSSVTDYQSVMMMMMSGSCGANSEDDFLGLFPPGNWELINSSPSFSKPQSFCHINKPQLMSNTTTSNIQEEKPGSNFLTTRSNTSAREENPSLLFMAAPAYHPCESGILNPNNPVYIRSAALISHIDLQGHDDPAASNLFHSTVQF